MKDEMPLRCEEIDGAIDMGIGRNVLKFAAENHPDFYDVRLDGPNIKITNAAVFAREVMYAINAENEDGSTLLTDMLDKAIKQAVENGCEGVDYDY